MARVRNMFVCRACGASQSRWMGKCPDCNAWDALEEQRLDPGARRDPQRGAAESWSHALRHSAADPPESATRAVPIGDLGDSSGPAPRLKTTISELDRVLGGGIVAGSAVLVGGDPGIGKSTLMLQAAGALSSANARVLYVSSEESAEQVRLRARRLGIADNPSLFVLSDTNLARIVEQTRRVEPSVLIIDSIQMLYKADLDASPGSITQLRRCAAELIYLAKLSGIAVVLVGHVTKDGQLAGPRLLEHLVDAVLYFEGDRYHAHRVLRAVKNRFGATLEIGIFEMTGSGLQQVPEGAGVAALTGADARPRPGCVPCPVLSGTRCILVEIQALTATGFLGAAKRKSSGLDPGRLAMIIAVLEQHAGLRLADRDVFASAVGGIRVPEPAADLALLLAIAGAHYKRAIPPAAAAFGEVGLAGEIRPVSQFEQRAAEAARRGFITIIAPGPHRTPPPRGAQFLSATTVAEAIANLA